jgi:ubiquinone/menaquinone biosynthesis C-methylase UbiE
MKQTNSVTPERLIQMAWGYAPPLIIEAAVRHHVFDELDKGPLTVDELASRTGASVRGLRSILDALVSLEFLTRSGDRYALAPESAAFLVSTKPAYHGGFFAHISDNLIPRWLQLTDVVRTGRPAADQNGKMDAPAFFAEFVESLFPMSYAAAQKLGESLDISKATKPVSVLDIGAGSGVWGIALAQQSRQVRLRAVDWPKVLVVTEKMAQRSGVRDRITLVPGDMFEADFGTGHQIATVGHILHGNSPEQNLQLLRKTFAALAPGGTIAIMEFLSNDERTGPPAALIFSVNMLVNTEAGSAYTFPEISGWLRQAGFTNPRLLDAPAVSPLVLATRP